jgi:hypothetical protein
MNSEQISKTKILDSNFYKMETISSFIWSNYDSEWGGMTEVANVTYFAVPFMYMPHSTKENHKINIYWPDSHPGKSLN